MSDRYFQLTKEQGYKLEAYLESGKNQPQIASLLEVHKSTISIELCRNVPKKGIGAKIYNVSNAQVKTNTKHQDKYKHITFLVDLNNQMMAWICNKKYSPEIVLA